MHFGSKQDGRKRENATPWNRKILKKPTLILSRAVYTDKASHRANKGLEQAKGGCHYQYVSYFANREWSRDNDSKKHGLLSLSHHATMPD
jgi:hypothetical protein